MLVDVVRGGDVTLLRLPDTILDSVVKVSPLVVTVRVHVVQGGDPTLVCLTEPTSDLPVPVSLVCVEVGQVG